MPGARLFLSRSRSHQGRFRMYDCSTIRTLIHPHLDGQLDVKESLRVQPHLQECAPCREVLLAEQAFQNFIRPVATPPPAPESVRQVVLEALSRETERRLRARRRWRGPGGAGAGAGGRPAGPALA